MTDVWVLVFVFALLAAVAAVFVSVSLRVRRRGGSLATVALGATHELLTSERRRAAETIVTERAGERSDDDESGGPETPGQAWCGEPSGLRSCPELPSKEEEPS